MTGGLMAVRGLLPPGGGAQPSEYGLGDVLYYPKCPIDRLRNQPGKPQMIYWDTKRKCYTCRKGHRFTGRE